ncbi:MAG: efflux RND transporter periplasmic adaptor subunit [Pseudotabrizicola sp.]|uniref:efflux RND transporter periplasmic adaptor subunit n=1 Tax=Pseudotabrizicola sp. TaxID=2939647 RepID=UPI00271C0EAB|nr:efflux RND transporter periplasmic adaptor subunit [Pseudotabrizicola sp.]MDO8884376.1 efflux RND transporter periplasmic adaptor subunit [Pseudotabrizicola sp.]MDP2080289.1 efflux RND transporter periplasmic adaptor subunit [Pseudotabrizicola sp.]MDZ7575374.1 efflux RND transporter periplasmic adaptor subunit [Pseudotabrizicola sp.]
MNFISRRTIFVLAAMGVVAIGSWFFLTERPVFVPVVTMAQSTEVRVYGIGTVEARIVSKISFEVGAALAELLVDSNDAVTKGQMLARLHPAGQQARVARAEAGVAASDAAILKAEANVTRAQAVLSQRKAANARQQDLASRNTVATTSAEEAQRDVDVAAAELTVAQSDVAVLRAQAADARAALLYEQNLLAHHDLIAPFNSVVVQRHAEAGTVVRAGDVIFTLMDPTTVWVQTYIDEGRAGDLALGQPAEIRLRSLPHSVYSGAVMRIGIESDRVNEERRVWLSCTDCPDQVFLGEQAEVRITTATLTDSLLVPEVAIQGFDGHQGRVWTLQDGRLVQMPLIFGHRTEDARVEVVSGLPNGAQIVASPVKGLAEDRMARVAGGTP